MTSAPATNPCRYCPAPATDTVEKLPCCDRHAEQLRDHNPGLAGKPTRRIRPPKPEQLALIDDVPQGCAYCPTTRGELSVVQLNDGPLARRQLCDRCAGQLNPVRPR